MNLTLTSLILLTLPHCQGLLGAKKMGPEVEKIKKLGKQRLGQPPKDIFQIVLL